MRFGRRLAALVIGCGVMACATAPAASAETQYEWGVGEYVTQRTLVGPCINSPLRYAFTRSVSPTGWWIRAQYALPGTTVGYLYHYRLRQNSINAVWVYRGCDNGRFYEVEYVGSRVYRTRPCTIYRVLGTVTCSPTFTGWSSY